MPPLVAAAVAGLTVTTVTTALLKITLSVALNFIPAAGKPRIR